MVMEYVSGIRTAWELAKAVKVSVDSLEDATAKLQMAELISALADAKMQAAESAERITELEKKLATKSQLKFDGCVYFKELDDGSKDGPWCPTCFDARNQEIRLHSVQSSKNGLKWSCKECKGFFI